MKTSIFLTGATGYIGSQLALNLVRSGYKVHVLVRNTNSSKLPKDENIEVFAGDLMDLNSIIEASRKCKYAFHVAAYTDLRCKNISTFHDINVIGTENVLKASKINGVKKVIFTSSLSVFGPSLPNNPITEDQPRITSYANDYELTKAMAEDLVKKYSCKGLPCVILNISRVYGPGPKGFSNGINRFISMTLKRRFILVPNELKSEANYVFIEDVIKGHILAMHKGKSGEKYIIGGENASYGQLFTTIKKSQPGEFYFFKISLGLIKAGLYLKNIVHLILSKEPGIPPRTLNFLFTNRIASSEKAIRELGYSITPLSTGISHTINFLNQYKP